MDERDVVGGAAVGAGRSDAKGFAGDFERLEREGQRPDAAVGVELDPVRRAGALEGRSIVAKSPPYL
jgi:hypothetical protein